MFAQALKEMKENVCKVIDGQADGLEKAYINREQDEHFGAEMSLKFLPKEKDGEKSIKCEAHLAYNPEKRVKDHVDSTVSVKPLFDNPEKD